MVNQLIKISIFLFSIIIIQSCNSTKSENLMLLNGKIDGLRKGTLYLQKFVDSTYISIDSTKVNDEF